MRMVRVNIGKSSDIQLGRQGENKTKEIVFDCSAFATLYGEGAADVIHRRPGEKAPYPCAITQEGNTVHWVITSADVARCGTGQAEIRWYVEDTLAKSTLYSTHIRGALDCGEEPPEPWESWVDQVLTAASTIKADAETAKENLDSSIASAETAKTNLESATSTANTARDNLEDATTTANTARGNLEDATAIANTANANLQVLVNSAEEVDSDINAAVAAANAAAENANAAATNANQAMEDADNAEDQRVQAEASRIVAEDARVQAESGRVSAENERVEAEKARQATSAAAVENCAAVTNTLLEQVNRIAFSLNSEDGGLDVIIYEEVA